MAQSRSSLDDEIDALLQSVSSPSPAPAPKVKAPSLDDEIGSFLATLETPAPKPRAPRGDVSVRTGTPKAPIVAPAAAKATAIGPAGGRVQALTDVPALPPAPGLFRATVPAPAPSVQLPSAPERMAQMERLRIQNPQLDIVAPTPEPSEQLEARVSRPAAIPAPPELTLGDEIAIRQAGLADRPVTSPVTEAARGLFAGAVSAPAEAMATTRALVERTPEASRAMQIMSQASQQWAPPDAIATDLFSDPKVALDPVWWAYNGGQAAGSILSLLATGTPGAAAGAEFGAALKLSPSVIRMLTAAGGSATSTIAESWMEGTSAYKDALDRGLSPDDAARAAAKVFGENVALIGVTNLPLFDPQMAHGLANLLIKGAVEGGQEGAQEVVQNQAAGRPLMTNVGTSFAVGALAGAGMHAVGAETDAEAHDTPGVPAPESRLAQEPPRLPPAAVRPGGPTGVVGPVPPFQAPSPGVPAVTRTPAQDSLSQEKVSSPGAAMDTPLDREIDATIAALEPSPVDESGRELGGYAGPERRSAARVATPDEDRLYQTMREKIARGEPLGSQGARDDFAAQQRGEDARRAVTPIRPRGATLDDEIQSVIDQTDTGEQQPRLPGAEGARQVGQADTTFKAPQQASGEDFILNPVETDEARTAREQAENPALFDAPQTGVESDDARLPDTGRDSAGDTPAAATGRALPGRARRGAGGARPDPRTAEADRLFPEAVQRARSAGYTGTDADLKPIYDRQVQSALELIDDLHGIANEHSPTALIKAIRRYGGLRPFEYDHVPGAKKAKLRGDYESIVESFAAASGRNQRGAASPFRNNGLGLDEMLDRLHQGGEWSEIESTNDLLDVLDRAARNPEDRGYNAPSIEHAIEGAVLSDPLWWADTSFEFSDDTDTPEPSTSAAPGGGVAYDSAVTHVTTPEGARGIAATGFDVHRRGGIGGDDYGPGVYLSDAARDAGSFWRDQLATKNATGVVDTHTVTGRVQLQHALVVEDMAPAGGGRFTSLDRRAIVSQHIPSQLERFDQLVRDGASKNAALGQVARDAGFDGLVFQRQGGDEIVAFDAKHVAFDAPPAARTPVTPRAKSVADMTDEELAADIIAEVEREQSGAPATPEATKPKSVYVMSEPMPVAPSSVQGRIGYKFQVVLRRDAPFSVVSGYGKTVEDAIAQARRSLKPGDEVRGDHPVQEPATRSHGRTNKQRRTPLTKYVERNNPRETPRPTSYEGFSVGDAVTRTDDRGDTKVVYTVKSVWPEQNAIRIEDASGRGYAESPARIDRVTTGGRTPVSPQTPVTTLEQDRAAIAEKRAANKAERARLIAELKGNLKNNITTGVDPRNVVLMVKIARTYIDDGILSFREAVLNFQEDFGEGARTLDRHFEIAWQKLQGESGRVADVLGEAQNEAGGRDVDADQSAGEPGSSDSGESAGGLGDGRAAGVAGEQPGGAEAPSRKSRASGKRRAPRRPSRADAGVGTPRAGEESGGSGGTDAPGNVGTADDVDDPDLVAAHARGEAPRHYVITGTEQLTDGGWVSKLNANMDALKLLKQLQADGRMATADEQAVLAKYIGWGHTNLAPIVDPRGIAERRDPRQKQARQELEQLLTADEIKELGESTANAHYSFHDLPVALWNLVDRLGFKGGSVLEPAVGTGHFFGTMPEHLRTAKFTRLFGVDKEPIAAAIARQLYQGASIQNAPLQEAKLPSEYFDLAISNVPFGRIEIFDPDFVSPERAPMTKSVHNYFFAKALDAVRPGGLIVFVTSSKTMDAKSDSIRQYIDRRARFLGAVRLTDTAFGKTAGTAVVADVIVLQKKGEGIPTTRPAWLDVEPRPELNAGGYFAKNDVVFTNQYFKAHPEMVLGTENRTGKMNNAPFQYNVQGDVTPARLAAAVERFQPEVYQSAKTPPRKLANVEEMDSKQGSFIIQKGAVYVHDKGTLVPTDLKGKNLERVRLFVPLRDAYGAVLDVMNARADDATLKKAQAAMKRAYDAFVKSFGLVSLPTNRRVIELDPNAGRIVALENVTVVKEGRTVRYELRGLADIFTKRTVVPVTEPTTAASPQDALVQSLAWRGHVDLEYMAKLTGQPANTLVSALPGEIFRVPGGDPLAYVAAEEYLSGDVVTKLAQAEAAASVDPSMRANVEALKAVQPKRLDSDEFDAPFGATWVPTDIWQRFLRDATKNDTVTVRLVNHEQKTYYYVEGLADHEFKPEGYEFRKWAEAALNGRLPAVEIARPKSEGGGTYVDEAATKQLRESLAQLREQWTNWWQDQPDVAAKLTDIYNAMFNREVARQFDGSRIAIPNASPTIKLRPWQKNVIWRILQSGNTLIAHAVGAGKTFAMIGAAGEMKRLGLARKPVIVVPNHLTEQWRRDFIRMYPSARVLSPGKADFEKANRRRLISQIANNEWDAIVMAQSQFLRVAVSLDTLRTFIKEQENLLLAEGAEQMNMSVQDFDQLVTDYAADDKNAKKALSSRNVERSTKDIVRAVMRLRARLQKRLDQQTKDAPVEFEQLGIDALMVDEAHLFKNLYFSTGLNGIVGLKGSDSDRALDMFLKVRLINKASNNRNVVFATGTPVANVMSELYTMFRYLAQDTLERLGMAGFDSWKAAYAVAVAQSEPAPEGGYKERTRLRTWLNLKQLSGLFRRFTDVVSTADLKAAIIDGKPVLELPTLKGGSPTVVALDPHPDMPAFMSEIASRIEDLKSGNVDPEDDNHLKISTEASLAAIDMRLVNPHASDDPRSRVNVAAREIASRYKATAKDKLTQIVFLDVGVTPAKQLPPLPASVTGVRQSTPVASAAKGEALDDAIEGDEDEKSGDIVSEETEHAAAMASVTRFMHGRDLYGDLVQKLVARGVKRDEIAFIHQARNEYEQGLLFDAVNDGRIRVLVATTAKGGVGMNVQKRLVALHHLDVPWRPADMEQREGRILRQGNQNPEVEIVRYVTKKSFDEYRWGVLAAKQGFIGQLLKGEVSRGEDQDTTLVDMEVASALSSGDPRALQIVNLERELDGLRARKTAFERKRQSAARELASYEASTARTEVLLEKARPLLASAEEFAAKPVVQITHGSGHYGLTELRAAKPVDMSTPEGRSAFQSHIVEMMHGQVYRDQPFATAGPFELVIAPQTEDKYEGGELIRQTTGGVVSVTLPTAGEAGEAALIGSSPSWNPEKPPDYARSAMAYLRPDRIAEAVDRFERIIQYNKRHAADQTRILEKTFAQDEELAAKEQQVADLRGARNADLSASAQAKKNQLGPTPEGGFESIPPGVTLELVGMGGRGAESYSIYRDATGETWYESFDGHYWREQDWTRRRARTATADENVSQATLHPAPLPRPGGTPVSPANAMRPAEIVKALHEGFGKLPISVGGFRQRAAGIFKKHEQSVRVKVAQDLPVIFHEIGHYLDRILLGIRHRDPRWRDELIALGQATSRPSANFAEQRREGAAEFFRQYLIDPAAAQRDAPNYYAEFTAKLAEHPEAQQVVTDVQARVRGYLAQDLATRGEMRVDWDGESTPPIPMKDRVRGWARMWVDDLDAIRTSVEAMRDGRDLPAAQNAYSLARVARGTASQAEAFLAEGPRGRGGQFIGPSLQAALQPVHGALKEFGNYLIALRVIELQTSPDRAQAGRLIEHLGIDLDEARAMLRKARSRPDFAEFERARDNVYAYNDAMLEYLRQYHALSDEQIAAIRRLNQYYVPLMRVTDEQSGRGGRSNAYANRRTPVRTLRGSGADIINPFESMVRNTFKFVDMAEKNRVLLALTEQASRSAGSGRWLERVSKVGATKVDVGRALDALDPQARDILEASGVDPDVMVTLFDVSLEPNAAKQEVTVIRNGTPELWQVHDAELFKALVAIGPHAMSQIAEWSSKVVSVLRAGATLTPGFIARNPGRDTLVAWMQSRYGFLPGIDTARGVLGLLRDDADAKLFKTTGVMQAVLVGADRDRARAREALERFAPAKRLAFARQVVTNPVELYHAALHFLQDVSGLMEAGSRLGEFKLALDAGGQERGVAGRLASIGRARPALTESGLVAATLAARDVTTDFSRGGRASREANQFYAFFNARVQGYVRMAEAMRRDPVGVSSKVFLLAALSYALAWWNEDDDKYRELPEWERNTYWHLPVGKGVFAKIPKPFEWGFIPNLIETEIERERRTAEGDRFATAAYRRMMPERDALAQIILGLTPTALAPLLEAGFNYSAFRRQHIVNPWDETKDPELQFNDWTSETAKNLGRLMGVSPSKIDHVIFGYTAGSGRGVVEYGLDPIQRLLGLAPTKNPPATKLRQIPVAGTFTRESAYDSSSQSLEDFYEAWADVQQYQQSMGEYQDAGDAQRFADRRRGAAGQRYFQRAAEIKAGATELKRLRKQIDGIYDAPMAQMTPAQKRARLDAVYEQMVDIARRALGRPPLRAPGRTPVVR